MQESWIYPYHGFAQMMECPNVILNPLPIVRIRTSFCSAGISPKLAALSLCRMYHAYTTYRYAWNGNEYNKPDNPWWESNFFLLLFGGWFRTLYHRPSPGRHGVPNTVSLVVLLEQGYGVQIDACISALSLSWWQQAYRTLPAVGRQCTVPIPMYSSMEIIQRVVSPSCTHMRRVPLWVVLNNITQSSVTCRTRYLVSLAVSIVSAVRGKDLMHGCPFRSRSYLILSSERPINNMIRSNRSNHNFSPWGYANGLPR